MELNIAGAPNEKAGAGETALFVSWIFPEVCAWDEIKQINNEPSKTGFVCVKIKFNEYESSTGLHYFLILLEL